jgi:hypothetical protein
MPLELEVMEHLPYSFAVLALQSFYKAISKLYVLFYQ